MKIELQEKFILQETFSIADAMSQIDINARGILFIADDENRLVGTLTDGDIRRWILNKGDLASPIYMDMNRFPKNLK